MLNQGYTQGLAGASSQLAYAGTQSASNVKPVSLSEPSLSDAQNSLAINVQAAQAHADRLEAIVSHLSGEGQSKDAVTGGAPMPAGAITRFNILNEEMARNLVRIEVASSRIGRLLMTTPNEAYD